MKAQFYNLKCNPLFVILNSRYDLMQWLCKMTMAQCPYVEMAVPSMIKNDSFKIGSM